MSIVLKLATEEDVDEYLRIEASVASRLTVVATSPAEVLEEMDGATTRMILLDGIAVGIISYCWIVPEKHAYLNELAVDPCYQGKGIGSAALSMVMLELIGARRVDLVTHPENPARYLYAKFGFVPTGVLIENYLESGEPRIEMARVLP